MQFKLILGRKCTKIEIVKYFVTVYSKLAFTETNLRCVLYNLLESSKALNRQNFNYYGVIYMKKSLNRIFSFIILLTMLCNMPAGVMEVSAAQPSEEISGEIEVILNRSEEDMRKYIDAFESKYPQVTVKYTTYSNYEASMRNRFASGDYGDVLYIPSSVDSTELLTYFDSLGNKAKLSMKYNYIEYAKALNASVYGLPSSGYLSGIIYNKEVFDKAGIVETPTTMDEFLYAMYLINEHTDAIPFFTGKDDGWMLQWWEPFQFIEMTGEPGYKFGQFIVEKEPFREGTVHYEALRFLYDLVRNGYTEQGVANISWDKSITMLGKGEIACTAIGTWAFTNYKNAAVDSRNIGFMPFPNSVNGNQYSTLSVDYCYGVARNSDNKAAAKAFVYFMIDESGYAFDHDTISIVKADPYPECYSGMTQTSMQNSVALSQIHYNQFIKLSSKLNLSDTSEYARIVEAAVGERDESFDDIMADWNARWESSRTEEMLTQIKGNSDESDFVVLNVNNHDIELSENELAYIMQNNSLRVGYHRNQAPLSFEKEGYFAGTAYDVCCLIEASTGLQMECVGFDTTQAMVEALQNGEIDIIAGIEKNSDSSEVRYSKEYLDYMDVVVRHSTVDGLSQKRLAVAKGEYLLNEEVEVEKVNCDALGDCIQKVQNLDADFTIMNYYTANYYMREKKCGDVTILPYAMNKTYHIGFSKEANPTLIAICNKCIYSIQEGEMQIALMDYMDTIVEDITLETYIAANPMQSLTIVILIFVVILGTICLIFLEKGRAHRKQALEAKKHESLAALADEYFFEYDCKKQRLIFDSKFRDAYALAEVIHKNHCEQMPEFVSQFLEQIELALKENKSKQFTISLDNEAKEKQWYRAVTSTIYGKRNQPVHLIGKLVNIQKEMEEVATYQSKAYRDPLTGLYNRDGFRNHMPDSTAGATFVVMDMDNFKAVNDTLGHDGGDYALTYFARKLEETLEKVGMVGRYGGDEFVAMLIDISPQEAGEYLEDLVRAMDVNLDYEGKTRHISVSVGAVYTVSAKSFEEMFREADEALYETKEAGKNSYTLRMIG